MCKTSALQCTTNIVVHSEMEILDLLFQTQITLLVALHSFSILFIFKLEKVKQKFHNIKYH